MLLRPLPFPDPDRIVALYETNQKVARFAVAPANFLDWQAENRVFEAMAAIKAAPIALSGAGSRRG